MADGEIFGAAQGFLAQEGLPGWLIYDYRGANPIFKQVVSPSGHVTRPCFLYIPAAGRPRLLVHHVDAGKFAETGIATVVYQSRETMVESLSRLLSGTPTVAMEYSPQNVLPRVSKVDAGTVELVRGLGVEVVSSADLMQYATQRWTPEQLAGHRRAAAELARIVNDAFRYTGDHLNEAPTEFQVAEFIRARFREAGLESADGPIVALNSHASDPHYEPAPEGSSVIRQGDWLLIDLWAREANPPVVPPSQGGTRAGLPLAANPPVSPLRKGGVDPPVSSLGVNLPVSPLAKAAPPSSPLAKGGVEGGHRSVYADITWVAYVGDAAPARHQEIFDIVIGARDAALRYLEESFQQGTVVQGWQADRVARRYISDRGYGDFFTHRLGHSIGQEVHGDAVNLDGFETQDTRQIIPGIGFSIEPGIYLPEFGVRSEIDAYMSETGPYATSPVQREVVLIRGR